MHGTRAANYAMDQADLILAVGAASTNGSRGLGVRSARRVIHIDVDRAEISKNVPAHIPIVGDAKNVLGRLAMAYNELENDGLRIDVWWDRIDGWRKTYPLRGNMCFSNA